MIDQNWNVRNQITSNSNYKQDTEVKNHCSVKQKARVQYLFTNYLKYYHNHFTFFFEKITRDKNDKLPQCVHK